MHSRTYRTLALKDKFATMSASARVTMMESAKYACKFTGDPEVAKAGLKILRDVGGFHLRSVSKRSNIPSPFGDDVLSLLQLILEILIFQVLHTILHICFATL